MESCSGVRNAAIALLSLFLAGACATPPSGVAELRSRCQVPGRCGGALACEGTTVVVRGRVDYNNVFDHARHPGLPYEKFSLVDAGSGQVLEIWAVAEDNASIFRTLLGPAARSAASVSVRGVVKGFDMPIMGKCTRDVRLELRSASDLAIGP